MYRWEIWKDSIFFAGFNGGDPCRWGGAFDCDEAALKEFKACVAYWSAKGMKAKWELRVHPPNIGVSKGVVIRQLAENHWTAYDNSIGINEHEGYGKTQEEAIADLKRRCFIAVGRDSSQGGKE